MRYPRTVQRWLEAWQEVDAAAVATMERGGNLHSQGCDAGKAFETMLPIAKEMAQAKTTHRWWHCSLPLIRARAPTCLPHVGCSSTHSVVCERRALLLARRGLPNGSLASLHINKRKGYHDLAS